MININKKHSIYKEMAEVHERLMQRYIINEAAKYDSHRAKIMTQYLQTFKRIANGEQISSGIGQFLEEDAIVEIAKSVGNAMGINGYQLFRMKHFWYAGKEQQRWGTDDVFEAELQRFLNIAYERATGEIGDAKSVGNLPGNIGKEYMKVLAEEGPALAKRYRVNNELISNPEFRSGKVDISSFSGSIYANINPKWEQFINIFKGAKFTVKNYSSGNGYEMIHLGNTDISKSLIGSLSNLGYKEKEAVHIYYHAISKAESQGEHIFHLRFAYELTGGGLKDKKNKDILEADFFIYNDPASNNIWVRSTKEMIANAMQYQGRIRDPLRSNIVVLKNNFS